MSTHRDILRKTFSVGAGTFFSRVTGLIRLIVNARYIGGGAMMNIFTVAFMAPNLFRSLFGEGALNVSFIPVFTKEETEANGDPRRLLNVVMTALTAVLTLIMLVGWAACAAAMLFWNLPENGRLFCILLAILLPYMPFICLTALQGGALNVKGRFFWPAVTPALMNICWIAGAWLFGRAGQREGVVAVSVALTISGALQFAAQFWMLRRCGMRFRIVWDLANSGLRTIVRLMLPVVFGLGLVQVNVLVDRIIAQFCVPGEGANSALFYGNQLMQFPLGVLGIALATAAYPAYARFAAERNDSALIGAANMSVRAALFISLPCAAALIALGEPMVRVLFQHGAFSADATARTTRVLSCYALGLWAMCTVQVQARAFQARQDVRTPVKVASMMVALKVALNLALVWPMQEAGLALASSIANVGNALLLALYLRRQVGPIGLRAISVSALKCSIASVAAGAAGYFVALAAGLIHPAASAGTMRQAALLALALGAAGATFIAVAWVVRSRELSEFAEAFIARRRKSSGN